MPPPPSLATAVPLDLIGTATVVDLEAACELYGRDMLPYPLGRSRPVGSVWLLTREVPPIEDRLNGGDLARIRAWVEAVVRADVCVGCRVSLSDDTPDLRLHALRADELGFVAVQHRDSDGVDIVDIYAVLSPGSFGTVIADAVALVGPGSHPCLAVTGCGDRLPAPPEVDDEYDDFGFPIPHAEPRGPSVHVVDGRHVVAIGSLQSRCDQTRHWVQIDDDGDYLYAPGDAGYAEPLDAEGLRTCVAELIAADVADTRTEISARWGE